MHTYEQNARGENHGIYTALFDNLRDSGVSDLSNQYVTAQKLDARFAFENNSKELLFDNFQVACDVLLAKYYSKWVNLIQGVLKTNLPAGASTITETKNSGGSTTTNNISAYDTSDLIPNDSSTIDNNQTVTTTTTNITGTEFIMNLYKNGSIYDIINADIRHTLFSNVYEQ